MKNMAQLDVAVAADGTFVFTIEGVVIGIVERGEFGMSRENANGLYVRLGEMLEAPRP